MSDYTPTTEDVRINFVAFHSSPAEDLIDDDLIEASEAGERFDRWLAEVKAAAWDEGFTRGFYDVLAGGDRDASESAADNPHRTP